MVSCCNKNNFPLFYGMFVLLISAIGLLTSLFYIRYPDNASLYYVSRSCLYSDIVAIPVLIFMIIIKCCRKNNSVVPIDQTISV